MTQQQLSREIADFAFWQHTKNECDKGYVRYGNSVMRRALEELQEKENSMDYLVITLGTTEHGGRWDHNTHRVILKEETDAAFVAWPDPSDPHCSNVWNTTMRPLTYPKYAWEKRA